MLPDTFGTTQFLEERPTWVADWTGQRVDSKDPYVAGDEYIPWLKERGRDPREKLLIASDTLDVDAILGLHAYFAGTLGAGLSPAISAAPLICKIGTSGWPADSLQRRLGHAADQRFPRVQSQRWRRLRSHQPDLQSFQRRRASRR